MTHARTFTVAAFLAFRFPDPALRPQTITAKLGSLGQTEVIGNEAFQGSCRESFQTQLFTSLFHAPLSDVTGTKSGKRRELIARLSFNIACELGFAAASMNGSPHGCDSETPNGSRLNSWKLCHLVSVEHLKDVDDHSRKKRKSSPHLRPGRS